MLNKENSEFSFLFSSALNNPVIFITNSTSKEQGSSIYIVHQNGTIRCSGANEGERKATTFIRPYLIGYISSKKEGVIFNQASLGLSPFEARAKNYSELIRMEKNGYGHMGNTITEILSFKNLRSPDFTPPLGKIQGTVELIGLLQDKKF